MAMPGAIEAVRNIKSQKLFIIVDDTLDQRMRLINPAGEVLILPIHLFENESIAVPCQSFDTSFAPAQLDAYENWLAEQASIAAANAARLAAARLAEAAPIPRGKAIVPDKPAPVQKRKSKGPAPTPNRPGLVASWTSPRLTFYAHRINPLQSKQSFKVTVEGIGDFVITKEEFLTTFNEVILSAKYKGDGLFAYDDIPEKAKKFLRTTPTNN